MYYSQVISLRLVRSQWLGYNASISQGHLGRHYEPHAFRDYHKNTFIALKSSECVRRASKRLTLVPYDVCTAGRGHKRRRPHRSSTSAFKSPTPESTNESPSPVYSSVDPVPEYASRLDTNLMLLISKDESKSYVFVEFSKP